LRHWESKAMLNAGNDFEGLKPTRINPADTEARHRFVVLFHNHPFGHWDWMFETLGILITFRSPPDCLHALQSGQPQEWTPLPNHRLHYLDYEGPLTGQRGAVKKILAGEFLWLEKQAKSLRLHLASATLEGVLKIEPDPETQSWLATWKAV
jgi:hypothetical protein